MGSLAEHPQVGNEDERGLIDVGMRKLGPKIGSQSPSLGVVSGSPGGLSALCPPLSPGSASPGASAPSFTDQPLPCTDSPYWLVTLAQSDFCSALASTRWFSSGSP